MRPPLLQLVLVLLALRAFVPAPEKALGGQRKAAAKVKEGIERFIAGDFPSAAAAFAEADQAKPDDPWIAFDRAVACAAQGDADQAAGLFQKAALSRHQDLATRARYNLGCLAADKARALFGEKPEKAAPDVRQQGLDLLGQAVGHYRDCLRLCPDHAEARYNLELIRLWIKHMQAAWEEEDRRQERAKLGLLEFLEMLQGRQRGLRATSRALDAEPDSPRRRQALSTIQNAQHTLAEEIEPLKEKMKAELAEAAPPTAAGAKPAPAGPARQKAVEAFTQWADEAGLAMRRSAERLHAGALPEAVLAQAEAVEKLDRITVSLLPFADLLAKAIGTQQALGEQVAASQAETAQPTAPKDPADWPELGWNQAFLPGWTDALAAKAGHELRLLDAAPDQAPAPDDPGAKPPPNPEQEKGHRNALKLAFQKAVELCPRARDLTHEAAVALKDAKPDAALPKQREALKLLQEIADTLPKQGERQQDPQKKPDQKPQDRPKQPAQGQDQQGPSSQPKDASHQQVEAVLRRARQRQRERQELEKAMQQGLYHAQPVEKDW